MKYWAHRNALLASTVSTLAFAIIPSGAYAQGATENGRSTEGPIGDIVVTARRRVEKLQDVPQAVSVMTQAELKTQLVRDQNDLQQKIPSLTLSGRFGHSGGTYAIRGLTGTNSGAATVGTYFAEVPSPTAANGADFSAGQPLYDLESVQVLKGPQGTLFGRSTTAGAVLVTPAAPDLHNVKANGSLGFGNLGYIQGSLAVSAPIIDGVLAIRVAANKNHRDGYAKVIGTGIRQDGLNNDAQRVSVLFQPVEWFRTTTIYNRSHTNQSSSAYIPVGYNSNLAQLNLPASTAAFNTACAAAVANGLSPSVAACVSQRLAILASIKANLATEIARTSAGGDELRRANIGNSTYLVDKQTHETVINRSELTLPDMGPLELELKNIFGYQKTKGFVGLNNGGIPEDLQILYVGSGAGLAANQVGNKVVISQGAGNKFYSNETQLAGKLFGDRLIFTGGYYYQHAPATPDLANLGGIQKALGGVSTVNLGYSGTSPFTVGGRANQKAFYGQATLGLDGLLDGVHLTAGVRHTKDDFLLRTAAGVTNPATGRITPSPTVATQAFKTSGTNYNFSADYKATPNLLVYIATRKGYVPGGLNNTNAAGAPNFKLQFDSETIKDVEAGFKWDFHLADTRGRFNMAAYRANYSNIQRPFTAFINNVSTSYIANVASARLRGVEVELTVLPTNDLTLGLSYSHADNKYKSWTGTDPYNAAPAGTSIDLSASPFQNSPRHKFNLNATYDVALSGDNGTISLTGQYTYQSRVYYVAAAERYIQLYGAVDPNVRDSISQKGYGIANVRVDWRDPLGHQGVVASLFARNLFDKIYATSGFGLNATLGVTAKQFGEPRIVGASVSFQY